MDDNQTPAPKASIALEHSPAVALLGPRQVGKTTLALDVGEQSGAHYLDLESEQDRAKLSQPELYLKDHQDHLVILDEVRRAPGLFPVLRGLIDRGRRAGRMGGQYLCCWALHRLIYSGNLVKPWRDVSLILN